jgi:ribosomal-protein-alanine N-acetyltransferase
MTLVEMARLHRASFVVPRPWSEAEIVALLASPLCFVVEAAQGFLMGRVVAGEAEVLTIAVDPVARRQGVGAGLMAGFLAEARARGAEVAFLEVAADNGAALRLYAASGFVETGRRRGYYRDPAGQPVDAVTMTRRVSAGALSNP